MAYNWFRSKYALYPGETWAQRCLAVVTSVCKGLMTKDEMEWGIEMMRLFKWMPGGRYIYYGGREAKFYNNCYVLIGQEDTREEWARLLGDAASCLLTGGGVGADYSVFRHAGLPLNRTGGTSSGPIPLMEAVNDFGRRARQGGGRRSALYASLDRTHGDIGQFLTIKDWKSRALWEGGPTYWQVKMENFDADAPLDMTNISVNYADDWVENPNREMDPVFLKNIEMAMRNGEPGFSFNFGKYAGETGRNACTEVSSRDDSDVCNLASPNLARIESREEMYQISEWVAKFQVCGSIRADVPYDRVRTVREKNRRLGQGIMGYHEWLLQRGYRYEYNWDIGRWLDEWEDGSEHGANTFCDELGVSRPIAYRAIAPNGTIGGLAGTIGGIEPIFAVAYKRRWLDGETRKYQYFIDHAAKTLIEQGHNPDAIESSIDLADDVERRIQVQYHLQQHVDQCISSTINLPAWGTDLNNRDRIEEMARLVSHYAPGLRGLTFYPDGSRGGQPLQQVDYAWAVKHGDEVFTENNDSCRDGVCGI